MKPEADGSANALIEYERGMLRRDVAAMARAAARLTGAVVTEESIWELNEKLGIDVEDETVSEIVRAAR